MKKDFSTNYPKPLAWNYELLADYVDGLVDQKTKTNIETALQDSEEAAMIVNGIRFYYQKYGEDRDGLDDYLDELAEQFRSRVIKPEAKVKRFAFSPRVWQMAAVILLLIVSVPVIIMLTRSSGPDPNAFITEQLSTPYTITSGMRDTIKADLKTQAYSAYKAGNYADCVSLLEKFEEETNLDPYDRFVLGLSYLYSENYEKATVIFDALIREKNTLLTEQSRWYLALAYLKMGDMEGGTNALHEIINLTGHYKAKEAAVLLESLEGEKVFQ